MSRSFTGLKRFRRSFGRIAEVTTMPNLIELQKNSYKAFLQMDLPHEQRHLTGLHDAFSFVFPVKDYGGRAQLEYFKYSFDTPKFDEEECKQRGVNFAAPLKVTFRLVVWDINEDTGTRSIRDIKEQDVYMGDIPIMTEKGTFIINGVERVVVSQMHRSPGVFFDHDKGKTHASGKLLYAARLVPYRGSWIDFEFDPKDILSVRLDRRRKISLTSLLMALDSAETEKLRSEYEARGEAFPAHLISGMSQEEILNTFYQTVSFERKGDAWRFPYEESYWKGVKLTHDLINADTGEIIAEEGTKISPRMAKKIKADGVNFIQVKTEQLIGRYLAEEHIDLETGKVFFEAGQEIDEKVLETIDELGLKNLKVLNIDHFNYGAHLRNTLWADRCMNREDALIDMYRMLRPGEPPTLEGAEVLFHGLFFDPEKYDLSAVGRAKLNMRLRTDVPDNVRVLRKQDIIEILRILLDLKDGRGEVDDIDNLGNRRVRAVGELLENQYRLGLMRMEKTIRERMAAMDNDTLVPQDLINAKPVIASVREFFGTSQLSQFMDQTNPLSEITHKRRLSAFGPGGLSRDRASFEVRDVHPTHYGRICPVETPEGPNIGLINSLSTYARVNKYGFIETPYRRVVDGKVSQEVSYLSAIEENNHTIAQANVQLDKDGNILDEMVTGRKSGEFGIYPRSEITLMDVSPKQLVSVAASLIPFLENDDANRALMGSNMQRQAVPLLRPEAPLVGTGMEALVAKDSLAAVVARRSGIVDQVDGRRIVVQVIEGDTAGAEIDIYNLQKFQRSNMSTCINQKPLVKKGDVIKAGDIIADGPATELGELGLGRNVLIGFIPWQGYGFEDSIIVSERISREDVFSSIHIEELVVSMRDTKLGNEEITRDIPNVSDEALRMLDEAGIVYVGAQVNAGDILVGKVTPKGEVHMTPEEKLLRAIFGEKASDVRDTSLRIPSGISGTVVDVRILSRRGVDKDERSLANERREIDLLAKDRDAKRNIIEQIFYQRLREMLVGQTLVSAPKGVQTGGMITDQFLDEMEKSKWRHLGVADDTVMSDIEAMRHYIDGELAKLEAWFEDKIDKVTSGDDLPPGVLKMVKVYVANKRKLQPGDKMAGRHGNKGVVSRIVPLEDMPHLEDGTVLDLVLNPLGLPSRMNVGQILETHLGACAAGMGRKVNDTLERMRIQQAEIDQLKSLLKEIYPKSADQKDLDSLNDQELLQMANNLRKGVPMATPVFDGAKNEDIVKAFEECGMSTSGQFTLIDGRTGEAFERKVTVGYMYMLKLHHLVDDKIHARSIGPYSLVTQQPLGGKAQFGGQRFGEMEVWALQAYGAAYTLQEMLTVKSDDVVGRTKVYEAIVSQSDNMEAGIPESFNVLVKELRSLGLSVSFEQED